MASNLGGSQVATTLRGLKQVDRNGQKGWLKLAQTRIGEGQAIWPHCMSPFGPLKAELFEVFVQHVPMEPSLSL